MTQNEDSKYFLKVLVSEPQIPSLLKFSRIIILNPKTLKQRENIVFLTGNELSVIIFRNTFNRVPDGYMTNNSLLNYLLFPGYRISGDAYMDYYKLDFLIYPYLHKDTHSGSIVDNC